MVRVKVHTILTLKKIVGQREVEVSIPQGSNVEELLARMIKTWGEKLSSNLFEPGNNSLLPHIRLMVNGQDLRFLNGMKTELQEGDEILILPPVAGG